jgi:hypothetical protein
MLLWSFSTRLSNDSITDNIKADYAYEVWVETQSIQDALDTHVCNLDTALLYMCREYLYKWVPYSSGLLHELDLTMFTSTRVTVTRTLRRFVPPSTVYVSTLSHFTSSLRDSDSGIPHHPVFSRKEAEEWRECHNLTPPCLSCLNVS